MCLRWFKCKLKPPTNVSQKNLSSHFETLNVKRYTVQLGTYDMITESQNDHIVAKVQNTKRGRKLFLNGLQHSFRYTTVKNL